jgi:Flp pilus assembly protein TadB
MKENPMPDDMRDLWQKQELEPVSITLEEIRQRAAWFRRRIYRRNLVEYAAGILAITVFAVTMRWRNGWQLVPPILLIAGLIYILYQLHRRAAAREVRIDDGLRASIELYRLELERQRDALRSVWGWYQLPLVPGILAMCVESAVTAGISTRYLAGLSYIVFVFAAIWWVNSRGARRLDRKIQELKALEEERDG